MKLLTTLHLLTLVSWTALGMKTDLVLLRKCLLVAVYFSTFDNAVIVRVVVSINASQFPTTRWTKIFFLSTISSTKRHVTLCTPKSSLFVDWFPIPVQVATADIAIANIGIAFCTSTFLLFSCRRLCRFAVFVLNSRQPTTDTVRWLTEINEVLLGLFPPLKLAS